VLSGIYTFKHKKEILEELMPDQMAKKPGKKVGRARPNAKMTNFHASKPRPPENAVFRRPPPQASMPRKQKPQEILTKEDADNEISDFTIETKGTPLSAMIVTHNGMMIVCSGKNHQSFLFAIGGMDYNQCPLMQQFVLHEDDITALSSYHIGDNFQIFFADSKKHIISSSTITFDAEVKAVATPSAFVPQPYKSSVQKLACDPDSNFVLMIVDRSFLKICGPSGAVLFEHTFPDKKVQEVCIDRQFTKLAVASGSRIEIYNFIKVPGFKLDLIYSTDLPAAINSISYSEKRKQFIAATAEGQITVFKEDIKKGTALKFSAASVRLVRASPTRNQLAIISQKAKLWLVDLETGDLTHKLDVVHRGDVHFLEWAVNGNWLFFGSKASPDIEVLHLDINDKQP
jgi:WD40 repeat protein